MKYYAPGSVEFHQIAVTLNGEPHEPDKVYAAPWLETPPASSAAWLTPTELDDQHGLMVGTYPVGYYRTWAYVADNPEQPRIEAEPFAVTDHHQP